MKNERRNFLKRLTFSALALPGISFLLTGNNNRTAATVIGCGPVEPGLLKATIGTVRSGNWSSPATWGGRLPDEQDIVQVLAGHIIVFDMEEAQVGGLYVKEGAALIFDADKSAVMTSTANVIVEGRWQMHPSSASVEHVLRFTGIDEAKFVGGGMDVVREDIGLWVMGAGRLELEGSYQFPWTRSTGAIPAGASSINVEGAVNWKKGDLICIAPTGSPADGNAMATGFQERIISNVDGKRVSLTEALAHAHPKVADTWTAEIMNMERNVRIEGTAQGRAHLFIRSTAIQKIMYTAFRYMGPRLNKGGNETTELVPGRYAMHFHHCKDGSRGSIVEGCVIRDCGNHSYVPHISHGISFLSNIAYNVLETAFWWDPGDPTHDVLYDSNLVARCHFLQGALNMNAENAPTFSSSGFALNTGDGNICINNVVVSGGQGDYADGGAYNWEAVINEGVWVFRNNIAHNCDNGLRVWQNSTRNHVIEDFFAYYNGVGVFHGAYANSYTYNGGRLYGNAFIIKAASTNSNRVRVENIEVDGAGLIDHGVEVIHSPLAGDRPVLLRNVAIKGCRRNALVDSAAPEVHSVDIVHCNIEGNILLHPDAAQGETIRVQPMHATPYQISRSGRTNILPFAATIWGAGKGLKGEYFNSTDFSSPALVRIDSNISFTEWSAGLHYAITSEVYSVRWTGYLLPQYSELHTFYLGAGGGFRLWVNQQLIANEWEEHFPGLFPSIPIALEAGKPAEIRLEFFNRNGGTGMGLLWTCKSLPLEYVPQSQLYAEPVDTVPPPSPEPVELILKGTVIKQYIRLESPGNYNYQLYDSIGRLLQAGKIIAGSNSIYISSAATGVLFLKVAGLSKTLRLIRHY
ncbi:PA14 domain-containing protein [Pseudoflavitalea rhizosphaerae]|uniref:PA14 domain-containing protein n=1 Tax=Pseudoflavitalea rhizosphaerae TaxID=1884793 RepID=UPI000F8CE16B|nr:PA14 domain-containing protein [Pseudoflavitalea rhizosphaerae]